MVENNGRLMDPTGSVFCKPEAIQADNEQFVEKMNTDPASPVVSDPPEKYGWRPCNGRFNSLRMVDLERNVQEENGQLIADSDRYIRDLFEEMDAYYKAKYGDAPHERKLVLIIHGGLNTNQRTLGRARDLSQRLLNDGYYPIFINWQSNLWRALLEHTTQIRRGENVGYKQGLLLAPFYLAGDLGRAVTRAPVVWFYALDNDMERTRKFVQRHLGQAKKSEQEQVFDELRARRQRCADEGLTTRQCDAIDIGRNPNLYRWKEGTVGYVRYVPTGILPTRVLLQALGASAAGAVTWLPPKYLVSPLLDGLGSAAWDNMERHAALAFHTDGARKAEYDRPAHRSGNGGISLFLRELQRRITDPDTKCDPARRTAFCIKWNITMVGHSMGAIVANHALRNFRDLPIDNIVYMAAACSVSDYEASVYPYMEANPHTQMYHLVLNDFAEVRDQYFFDIAPSGSLLVWIDNYFTHPRTVRDRTAGRWDNLMRVVDETPEKLRPNMHVKAFGIGRALELTDPQHHGSFGDFNGDPTQPKRTERFWRESFWKTDLTDLPRPAPAN